MNEKGDDNDVNSEQANAPLETLRNSQEVSVSITFKTEDIHLFCLHTIRLKKTTFSQSCTAEMIVTGGGGVFGDSVQMSNAMYIS